VHRRHRARSHDRDDQLDLPLRGRWRHRHDGAATLLDNYEWAKIDITLADGSQAVSAFAIGRNTGKTADQSIGGARAFASTYSANDTVKSQIGGTPTVQRVFSTAVRRGALHSVPRGDREWRIVQPNSHGFHGPRAEWPVIG
jgi:hypothetical protein